MSEAPTFVEDVTALPSARDAFDAFRRSWERQVREPFPAPSLTSGGDFRISVRATKVGDSVLADVHSKSLAGNVTPADQLAESVLMHVVTHGAWSFARLRDGGPTTVPAGHFSLRRGGPPTREVAPEAAAKVLILPESPLRPIVGDRLIIGPAAAAELRVLTAHVALMEATAAELTPAGALAAHGALIELVKGAATQRVDGAEPLLAPALAGAARDLVEQRLADPDLSPSALARQLHVSVRTLQRAFATGGESLSAYIRRRRLEQARRELTARTAGIKPSVTELAAHWQFADSSHFIRAFKRQYGQTPGALAHSE